MRLLQSLVLFVVALIQQLRQLRDWAARTRWALRFLLACTCAALTAAFGSVFARLPNGWFDELLAHLFSVPGVFVAAWLTLFFVASAGMGLLTEKVRRTL
jgi:hypothetical protein